MPEIKPYFCFIACLFDIQNIIVVNEVSEKMLPLSAKQSLSFSVGAIRDWQPNSFRAEG